MKKTYIVLTVLQIGIVVLFMPAFNYTWFSFEVPNWAVYFFAVPIGYTFFNIFKPTKPFPLILWISLGAIASILLDRSFVVDVALKKILAIACGALLVWFLHFLKNRKAR